MRAVEALAGPGFLKLSADTVSSENPDTAKNYIDRVKAYIPAEVVAFFIFVNSLVIGTNVTETNGDAKHITVNGYVALAALVLGIILSWLYARSAAKNSNSPWLVQTIVTVIAFIVWSYATDARAYDVLGIDVVPSVSGLLIAAFTVISGLIIPVKKQV